MRAALCLSLVILLGGPAGAAAPSGSTQTFIVGQRSYTLPADLPVIIDGQPAILADLAGRTPGMQVRWQPSARGTPTPVFSYTLIGPVTGRAPLTILGQPLTITGDTTLDGFDDIGQLSPGDPMVVAGLVDANGSVYATLVERRGAQGNRFLLSGRVHAVQTTPAALRVGDQWLATGNVTATGCNGGSPVIGDHVDVRADAIPGFQPGDIIDTVSDLACTELVPFGTPGAQGAIEGVVSAVPSDTMFQIGALAIEHGPTTAFGFGGPDDIEPGALVGIEGTFTAADRLSAADIEFVRPVVRFEAPMTPADVTPGVSLRPFGVEVFSSAQLRDSDGVLGNGLGGPRQVRVRGWLDREGVAWATRVRDRGSSNPADVALRGPVQSIAAPMLTVQGLTIDTTGARFFDADEKPIDAATFFADVRRNHVVDIAAATWTAATRTLAGGDVILLGYEHTEPVPGDPTVLLQGTVRAIGTADPVFNNGFEAR